MYFGSRNLEVLLKLIEFGYHGQLNRKSRILWTIGSFCKQLSEALVQFQVTGQFWMYLLMHAYPVFSDSNYGNVYRHQTYLKIGLDHMYL